MLAAVAALLAALAPGSTASAHGGVADATNYSIRVLDGGDPQLEWSVRGGDSQVVLTNRTGEVVVIGGYEGEPYLRFVPDDGVFRNQRSPATYLNDDRYARTPLPADADADAEPEWERVAGGETYAWHDHRTHWMSTDDPPVVQRDRSSEHVVQEWSVPITLERTGRQLTASGDLRWIPPTRWWPPVLALAIVFGLIAVASAVLSRPAGLEWKGLARPVTIVLGVVLAANVVRVIDDITAVPATIKDQIVVAVIAGIALGALTALGVSAWRGRPGGVLALAVAGVLTMLWFGGEASSQLTASQIATNLPVWVRRWTVAASYTVIVATTTAAGFAGAHVKRYLDEHPGSLRDVLARPAIKENPEP